MVELSFSRHIIPLDPYPRTQMNADPTGSGSISLVSCGAMFRHSAPYVLILVCVKVENLDDPITPVIAILARVPREHLMLQYGLKHFQVKKTSYMCYLKKIIMKFKLIQMYRCIIVFLCNQLSYRMFQFILHTHNAIRTM